MACGSGSVAAAAAARYAGLVADTVSVANPGGLLSVELSGSREAPSAILTGPARRVAAVRVELAQLGGPAA
jgi:diaminopimelate epimerase